MTDHIRARFFIPLFWIVYVLWTLVHAFICWFGGGCPDFMATVREQFDFSQVVGITTALYFTIAIANRLKDWWLEESEQKEGG